MMKRDVIKKSLAKRRTRRRWLMTGIVAIFLITAVTGLFIAIKKQWINPAAISASFTRGTNWAMENKNRIEAKLARKVEKVKRIARPQNSEDEEIHFEFYTALQTMQLSGSHATTVAAPSVSVASESVKQKPVAEKKPEKIFMNPDELERDFSQSLIREAYVIQAGVFSTSEAAEEYSKVLAKEGYPVDINKIENGNREMYKVQIGPFVSKDKATSVQAQLQQKGIQGILRTVELS